MVHFHSFSSTGSKFETDCERTRLEALDQYEEKVMEVGVTTRSTDCPLDGERKCEFHSALATLSLTPSSVWQSIDRVVGGYTRLTFNRPSYTHIDSKVKEGTINVSVGAVRV